MRKLSNEKLCKKLGIEIFRLERGIEKLYYKLK